MPSGSDRLTNHLIAQGTADAPEFEQAKVTAFSGGIATVSWRGGTYQFPRDASYTPVVNDLVAIGRFAGSWLILCKVTGFPV